jgi:hypothetical protein
MEDLTIEEQTELNEIASYIRKDIKLSDVVIYTNKYGQIVIENQIFSCETMFSIKTIMKELNRIREEYLQGFESNFEIIMGRQNPIIYCTYERIKAD